MTRLHGWLRANAARRVLLSMALMALAVMLLSLKAHAADVAENHWLIAPYLWAPALGGSVTFGGATIPLDISASELAGGLKAGALGYGQWHHDDQFLYAEVLGFAFKDEQFEPVRGLDIKAKLLFAEVGYGHDFSFDVPLPTDGNLLLSTSIGIRYASLDATASTPDGSLIQQSMTSGNQWIDPTVGLIIEAPLTGRLSLAGKFDASGFGLNHDRYLSGIGLLRWYFTPDLSGGLGYRVTRFDADPHGGNDLKLRLRGSGPEVGLAYGF